MKNLNLSLVTLASVLTFGTAFAEPALKLPQLVNLGAEHVFSPPGFDDNDNVQIVVHGELPNTCYKAAAPAVSVDRENHKIFVSAMAYYHTGCWCLEVTTPFTRTIDLGLLGTGSYQVVEVQSGGRQIDRGSLPIARAKTAESDDHLYAPVKTASVDKTGPQPVLHLSGELQSNCLALQQVQTLHRDPRIIEVLPIVVQKPGVACTPNPVPFETTVALPITVSGDNLIHIRSMSGNSVNIVESF